MNNIRKTVLALIAVVTISANTSQAGEGAQPAPRQFQTLVTDDAALDAWLNGNTNLTQPQSKISFDGMPVNDVAQSVVKIFKNQFDLILPAGDDPGQISVKLELQNVNALEIFNAMNMYFETGNIPAHWKLTLNGSRPTAILEIKKSPVATAPAETERKHTVFSIADILSVPGARSDKERAVEKDKRIGWIMDAIAGVLNDTKTPPYVPVTEPVKIHGEAGLLVFTGTAEETELVRSTLEALKQTMLVKNEEFKSQELQAKAEAARKAAENLKK